ncbi:MAG: hypothetical protein E6K60_13415 [Nitrospirae bacterium]|nr:MAG: hypothetical protein E6K60_13415 [Nitrospirota bacterium]
MRCVVLITQIILASIMFGIAGDAAAKESFKDEAGELLYSIDDDGIVSMFENSPGTDVTLSVTRGTREQMQPQITSITPASVAAGSYTVLKIEGKNLVGAKVKVNTPGIEVSGYSGKPKRLDVPINVPLSFSPQDVTIEVTTPIGATKVMIKVTEVQIGGGGMPKRDDVITHPGQGYGADEGSGAIATTAPMNCPPGMVGLGGEGGGFCIELDHTFKGDFKKAEHNCAIAGKRLCRLSEWQLACEKTAAGKLPLKNMRGQWEWTGGFDVYQDDTQQDTRYFMMGKSDCEAQHPSFRLHKEEFPGRCCK